MTIAAIDFGRRRIGIALADNGGLVIRPLEVVERHALRKDLEAIKSLFARFEVDRVIVGLPLNMDGSLGPQARAAESFADNLRDATGLAVELCDERLTTFEAEERLRALSGRRPSQRRRLLDAVAASIILESWFELRKSKSN